MGCKREFSCPKCGFQTTVEGERGRGLLEQSEMTTILCRDCRDLFDVSTYRRKTLKCPECVGAEVEEWRFPGPCPKCGAALDRGGVLVFWD